MITALDSKVMDANAASMGVDTATLMGRAGRAVADLVKERFPGKRILICCGHGNNGGDGFAAATMLPEKDVTVCTIDPPSKIRSEAALSFYYALKGRAVPFEGVDGKYDVLVDAGLGTGLRGAVRPAYSRYIDFVNRFEGTVVSVDVPTGLGADKAVRPDVTVALHDVKEGCDETNCGEIVVADIGMPEDAYAFVGPGDMLRYPVPGEDSHKGDNGRLLVIGGGPYHGAPAMASMAALRVGADLVTAAVPESVFDLVASVSPVLVMRRLSGDRLRPEHVEGLLDAAKSADAVLIGPGLGRAPETVEAVRDFVGRCDRPMVIDADGLNALGDGFVLESGEAVLTPHRGEFARLGGRGDDAESLAKRTGCTVLLKGAVDIISDGERTRRNRTGCPGMTGAGTGDVLAGIVGGLLAKGMSAFDAACLGAYISGAAGEEAFAKLSYGMIATDVVDRVPKVLRKCLRRTCSPSRASRRSGWGTRSSSATST